MVFASKPVNKHDLCRLVREFCLQLIHSMFITE
jgi:hypothetical protein